MLSRRQLRPFRYTCGLYSLFGSQRVFVHAGFAHAMASSLEGDLVQAGFPNESPRLEVVLAFLAEEEFTSLEDLRGALHSWQATCCLVKGVCNLLGRRASRYA